MSRILRSRRPIPILVMHDKFFEVIEEINDWMNKLDQVIYDFTYTYPKPDLKILDQFNRIEYILLILDGLKITDKEIYDFHNQGKHCICRCNYIADEILKLRRSN